MENDNAKLKHYLLGNLPPDEIEAIDLEIISDGSLEEKLHWAENELMEDYLDKVFSPAEVNLFENNFLVSSERKIQLRQLALLKKFARHETTKDSPIELCEKSSGSFFEELKKLFFGNWRLAAAGFALFVIVSLVGTLLYNASKQTPLEKEFAQINQNDLSNLAEFKNLSHLNLAAGTYRDANEASKFSVDKLSEKILVRLALPTEVNPTDTFKIEVIQADKGIFSQNKIRFYDNSNGRELRLLLPSSLLKKGDYQIKAAKENSKDSIVVYNFAIR